MAAFDFMAFGYDAGDSDMFVAHAGKYSAEETIDLCKREFDYKFRDHTTWGNRPEKAWREPTIEDVQSAHCAFRFGNPEWPDGCYTLVGEGETASFPVHVIDFEGLQQSAEGNT